VSEPISPPAVTDYKPEYIPAYLSNGLIGIRVGRIPLVQGLAIVNGLAAVHPADEVEGFSRAPYPIAGDIAVNRIKLSEHPERARFIGSRTRSKESAPTPNTWSSAAAPSRLWSSRSCA